MIDLTVLFADVRGSTALAEEMGPVVFAELMQRFYRVSNSVFTESDAFIDAPVGDEVRAFYFPVFTPDHAAAAMRSARGYSSPPATASPEDPGSRSEPDSTPARPMWER